MAWNLKTAKKFFPGSNIKSAGSAGYTYNKRYKIVVFVPNKNVNEITFAMAEAGAGVIGNYTVCSFRMQGTGTFRGNEFSNPAAGKKQEFETVDEIRLEMICSRRNLDATIDKMLEAHPYEEPAYEIYELLVREKKANDKIIKVKLKRKVSIKSIIEKMNDSIEIQNLPKKMKNLKIKQAIIDYSDSDFIPDGDFKNKTLYIKKNKSITNFEII
jgi:hypothetical protein